MEVTVSNEKTVDVDLSKYVQKHVQSFAHVQREVEKLTSYKIPGSRAAKNVKENCGAPPMFSNTSSTSTSTTRPPQQTVHIVDRVCNMETMVCAFLFLWLSL